MDAATDELTRPLGADRPEVAAGRRRVPVLRVAAVAVSLGVVALVGVAAWFGNGLGGVPHVRVAISTRPAAAPSAPSVPVVESPNGAASSAVPHARSADQIETASGVSVIRPAGTAAPASVIVQVPEDVPAKPGADPRLLEKSRFGSLPKIGPDGSRPADVYARPSGSLPGGVKPVGRVAIVVGGLGISESATADAIATLPPAVTLAFAPYGPQIAALALRAREAGHEILLQVPMEPFDYPDSDPGPHTLTTGARPAENIDHLRWAMGRIAGFVGIVNYMGAKLTADPAALTPILRELKSRGLLVLDDGSSLRSRVTALSEGNGARADIVLDAVARRSEIEKALQNLEALAVSQGLAVATVSAVPVALERLQAWTRTLEARGILLVPLSAAFAQGARRSTAERTAP